MCAVRLWLVGCLDVLLVEAFILALRGVLWEALWTYWIAHWGSCYWTAHGVMNRQGQGIVMSIAVMPAAYVRAHCGSARPREHIHSAVRGRPLGSQAAAFDVGGIGIGILSIPRNNLVGSGSPEVGLCTWRHAVCRRLREPVSGHTIAGDGQRPYDFAGGGFWSDAGTKHCLGVEVPYVCKWKQRPCDRAWTAAPRVYDGTG